MAKKRVIRRLETHNNNACILILLFYETSKNGLAYIGELLVFAVRAIRRLPYQQIY
jgi:hypothetical protein